MKKFRYLLFLVILLTNSGMLSAQKYYDEQWNKIEANSKKGLFKSNLPIILEIQNTAMKEDNTVELIRSLKAEFTIVNQTEDDSENDAASQFFGKLQNLGDGLNGEEKLVYQVLLGEFFNEYYLRNQWQINARTNINN